jgi:hypothetical protein
MKALVAVIIALFSFGLPAVAQQPQEGKQEPPSAMMHMGHGHSAGAPVSFTELKETLSYLERAREATAKYRDVRVAEADGYRAIGPDVPGMGIHYVLPAEQNGFDAEKPPILLYEKNQSAPGGFALVGVSYLLNAPEGPDGQPLNSPFPKALAVWHRHENICVLPDRSATAGSSAERCREKGGHFSAETQWMVHAWIWKDSALGVFSPENPSVL